MANVDFVYSKFGDQPVTVDDDAIFAAPRIETFELDELIAS